MAEGGGNAVARSSRADRAAESPHDHVNPSDQPQVGRDVPAIITRQGFPAARWETRVQSYGPRGLYHETRCHSCMAWLTYPMCLPCQARFRLSGRRDMTCRCLQDSLYVYGRCEDHRIFQRGPDSGFSSR